MGELAFPWDEPSICLSNTKLSFLKTYVCAYICVYVYATVNRLEGCACIFTNIYDSIYLQIYMTVIVICNEKNYNFVSK